MRRALLLAAALAVCAAATTLPACFSPQKPACAFSCARDGLCPSGYVCADDGLCHRADGVGLCLLTPPDGAVVDSGAPTQDGQDGPEASTP